MKEANLLTNLLTKKAESDVFYARLRLCEYGNKINKISSWLVFCIRITQNWTIDTFREMQYNIFLNICTSSYI